MAAEKFEKRLIFISHSIADRNLATQLKSLIEKVYSGLVEAYISSDPSPAGGVQPGEEWYTSIHEKLEKAEAVWVLATAESVQRPWLYWESGVGRAVCKNVCILRVKLELPGLPSPLSFLQSYDALSLKDGGITEMLGKVGNQMGMAVPKDILSLHAKQWVEFAEKHKPEPRTEGETPTVDPEKQLGPLEAVTSRLERLLSDEPLSRPSRRLRLRRTPDMSPLESLRGAYSTAAQFARDVSRFDDDTSFKITGVDIDGDVRVEASRGEDSTILFLHPSTGAFSPEELKTFPKRAVEILLEAKRLFAGLRGDSIPF